jgi:hypothetical protein
MKSNTILELDSRKAREYLLLPSSYCTVNLPEYYDFTKILSFVQKVVGRKDIYTCLADKKKLPSSYEGVNHQLLINKDGRYAYRKIQLANPFIYYLLVRTITETDNWNAVKKHFVNQSRPNISVASLPKIKTAKKQAQAGVEIPAWWDDFEQKSITLALKYQYVFVTDISDCYGSIYTHTIPWSLYGKAYAKEHRTEKNLGNAIDRYMGAMNYDQTNGIPQGSVLFDLIAEIVLAYADACLYDKLADKCFSDQEYYILRYRDDYRVFANSKERLETIVKDLQEVLIDLNLRMNPSKTHMSEDIVLSSIKADKLAYLSESPIYKSCNYLFPTVQKELFYILQFAKKYPNSGMVTRLLSELLNRIDKSHFEQENMHVLISITLEIVMTSPRVFNVGTALISCFLNRIEGDKAAVIKDVYHKLSRLSNTGELEIWLQRVTCHLDDVEITYDEPLTHITKGNEVQIWNNTWVKPELLESFPLLSVCNTEIRDSQTPVITANEVSVFDY